MRVPAPRFQRIATLIAIDSDYQVALLRTPNPSTPIWGLPQRRVGLTESYRGTITRLAGQLTPERSVRWGDVIGHLWAPAPENNAARTEVRYFIARANPAAHTGIYGDFLFWVPRASLGTFLDPRRLEVAAMLVDGYLDGWLPDGPITLD
ncbi:hypothetical protein [Streptomyces sp. WZ-12]|uniref:hypothetical protein n=1 Tax=Streptomyces sp. WZ-12 TaxID=3030210 RepID=UPI0023816679|nr:hypothetical protein [Streptomyces sp. WZ-12]